MKNDKRQKRAKNGRRQPRKNRDWMYEAFIQDAEHDVDHQNRDDEQDCQILKRFLELLDRTLKIGCHARGNTQFPNHLVDRCGRLTHREAGLKVEGDGSRRDLRKMVHAKRTHASSYRSDLVQRNQMVLGGSDVNLLQGIRSPLILRLNL